MFKNFVESAKKLKETRVLCACAVLIAVYAVLYALPIQLSTELRITFTFIPIAISGWLFGPVPAMLVGGISDVISSAFLFPKGPYFPGFTVTAILSGLVFGLFLYKRKTVSGVIFSRTIINLFLNIVLNSFWLSILYKKGFIFYLISHFFKNILLLPIEITLLIIILKIMTTHGIKKMYKSQ